MAVLAYAQVTLAVTVDVEAVTTWYRLQASSSAAPAKPDARVKEPTDWSETEPAYTGGSTYSLYTCQRTDLTDGTWAWSEVSLSSSYEAAKAAWNKAKAAADAAAETANHFWHDSGGAHVSTVAGSTATGDAVTLTGSAMTFTSNGDEVASFGRTRVVLGLMPSSWRVGDSAQIILLDGSGAAITYTCGSSRDEMRVGCGGHTTIAAHAEYGTVTLRGGRVVVDTSLSQHDYPGLWVDGRRVMVEPDVLYDSAGTTGTVTLSASAANYDHMRIYYRCGADAQHERTHDGSEVCEPDGKRVSLSVLRSSYASGSVELSSRVVLVSGTTISDVTHSQSQYGAATGVNTTNDIYIYRVEAW